MAKPIRRVVTGMNPDGTSGVTYDGPAPMVVDDQWPGSAMTELWVTDEMPVNNSAPGDRAARPFGFGPGPAGTVIRFCEMQPDPDENIPIMHKTATLDYQFVIAGELTLLMEDGTETVIGPGDIVIQQGTTHAWANRGTETVFALVMQLDAIPVEAREGATDGAA